MATLPTGSDERLALRTLSNHAEFKAKLVSLSMHGDLRTLESHVHSIALRWFDLARLHLADAVAANPTQNPRSVYSRSYYAAYNASKAVRYVVRGYVSLHGDDHKEVAKLPSNFPDVDSWVEKLPVLYQHRLRADYDNWSGTDAENQLSAMDCLQTASEFLLVSATYLEREYGLTV